MLPMQWPTKMRTLCFAAWKLSPVLKPRPRKTGHWRMTGQASPALPSILVALPCPASSGRPTYRAKRCRAFRTFSMWVNVMHLGGNETATCHVQTLEGARGGHAGQRKIWTDFTVHPQDPYGSILWSPHDKLLVSLNRMSSLGLIGQAQNACEPTLCFRSFSFGQCPGRHAKFYKVNVVRNILSQWLHTSRHLWR